MRRLTDSPKHLGYNPSRESCVAPGTEVLELYRAILQSRRIRFSVSASISLFATVILQSRMLSKDKGARSQSTFANKGLVLSVAAACG
jgi:hypothetical protein